MSEAAPPNHAVPGLDPAVVLQIPAEAYDHLVRTLRLTLPPPLSDAPEDLARRDHAAIARIAALAPADVAEADLATQFVAASEQWKDCLRLAQSPGTAPEWAGKCRAQALAMMRQANGALRVLLRLQARRGKLETDHAARDRAAWAEHCALGLMAQALAALPRPDSLAEGTKSATTPLPREEQQDKRASDAPPPASAPHLDPDLIAAAERYAAVYPERAAAMRRSGRLPCDVRYFDPPEAALAPALIDGCTAALAAIDSPPATPPRVVCRS